MKVYVASVSWRQLQAEHTQCLAKLLGSGRPMVWAPYVGDALIERARAISATRFLKDSDCDVYLSLDDDLIFRPDDAWRICEQAMEHDIVGGVYVTRNAERCFPSTIFYAGQPVDFDNEPRLVECRWPATGFLAVHRRVFEKLALREDMPLCHPSSSRFHPFFTPFTTTVENGETILLSEDYAFAERAHQEGFRCYVDPSIRLGHIGMYCYELADVVKQPRYQGPIRMTRREDGRWKIETVDNSEAPIVVSADGRKQYNLERRPDGSYQVKSSVPVKELAAVL